MIDNPQEEHKYLIEFLILEWGMTVDCLRIVDVQFVEVRNRSITLLLNVLDSFSDRRKIFPISSHLFPERICSNM